MDTAPWDARAQLLRVDPLADEAFEQQIVVDGTLREIAEYLWASSDSLEQFAIIWKEAPVRVAALLDRAVREKIVP